MRKQAGFTLIEIAIVLVIVGLLLGGVLKGQELITSARVRNVASQLEGVKIAYLGFQDRYRSLPGDYLMTQANANIPGPTLTVGCTVGSASCQNGRIDNGVEAESLIAWHQLSRAGFITGSYDAGGALTAPAIATAVGPANTPQNPFGGNMQIIFDSQFGDLAAAAPAAVFNIKAGGNIPAAIAAEIDRKIDDGNPVTGSFRTSYTAFGTPWDNATATCVTGVAPAIVHNAASDVKTCGGVALQ